MSISVVETIHAHREPCTSHHRYEAFRVTCCNTLETTVLHLCQALTVLCDAVDPKQLCASVSLAAAVRGDIGKCG